MILLLGTVTAAARLMDMLEEQGVVGPAEGFVLRLSPKGQGSRAVLVGAEERQGDSEQDD